MVIVDEVGDAVALRGTGPVLMHMFKSCLQKIIVLIEPLDEFRSDEKGKITQSAMEGKQKPWKTLYQLGLLLVEKMF